MNMAGPIVHGSLDRVTKSPTQVSAMSSSDRTHFQQLAERARARLRKSGAWKTEVESREDIEARVKKAIREKREPADA